MVKVRIAPSPTGLFHVGTARTALYNWLFARKHRGQFVLRIEDTDVERSKREMVDVIIESLNWLGLGWDGEPTYQSERTDIHRRYVDELERRGIVYPCYCTAEELAARRELVAEKKGIRGYDGRCRSLTAEEKERLESEGREKALRFHVPEGKTRFFDEIHGWIEKENAEIADFVVLKSDGMATYNMAVVADDAEMKITHVIRGNDHISNTPKQVMLYDALGLERPKFAHLPLILGEDRAKFSKRHGSVAVTDYREEGYLSDALVNFLALLGWSPGDDREVMTREELISAFSLERVMKSGAVFDMKKLLWINGEYIGKMTPESLLEAVFPFLGARGLLDEDRIQKDREWFLRVMDLLKSRLRRLSDFATLADYFFTEDYQMEEDGLAKHVDKSAVQRLSLVGKRFSELSSFTESETERVVRELADELEVKAAKLIHPIRLAVSGKQVGPGLFEMLELLGKKRVTDRIARFVALSSSQA